MAAGISKSLIVSTHLRDKGSGLDVGGGRVHLERKFGNSDDLDNEEAAQAFHPSQAFHARLKVGSRR